MFCLWAAKTYRKELSATGKQMGGGAWTGQQASPSTSLTSDITTVTVAAVKCATSNISAFIDQLLKAIVKQIPHILTDSSELINDLQGVSCSDNTLLVSLDITSLYPNIPIQESNTIILNFIKEQNNPTHPPICILNTLLSFVLNYKCFNYGDLFFLQVHGIAMGTKLVNYAKLFMANFEINMCSHINNLLIIEDSLMISS